MHLQDSLTAACDGLAVAYDPQKGKHIVAQRTFEPGEVLFTERAWVQIPLSVPSANDMRAGKICHDCAMPAPKLDCRHRISRPNQHVPCRLRYCSDQCRMSSESLGGLCMRNEAYTDLFEACLTKRYFVALAVLRMWLIRARAQDGKRQEQLAFASTSALAIDERIRMGRRRHASGLPLLEQMHELVLQLMPTHKSRHTFDEFCEDIGRFQINGTHDGALFMLHSIINHACDANVDIRPLDCPSRIKVVASRRIDAGEEVNDLYVRGDDRLYKRRAALKDQWAFDCTCRKCSRELQTSQRRFILGALLAILFALYGLRR
ncbi:uncharacterized protein L969DRAFT_89319 [Mixia osmundae IAM 14324]|uniref:Histone-lysine N-methyltransferase SET5 n=1 Tax=Mixia osmundae (strain CBS 9802 / IAM 14324 / JCM 22182 / KY 12970) TaxID=764103 RepID=G7DX34_MIXOS|nr:uncharacterized protein L969DRAFT_89319 [Mixia osmundae IAM 14324]KEI38061.1 hypothetical protein L969DRAFT_89319 [Mixia osmundae IAM 14324]GAA95131.1 hypothetical protein E5Q_01786 [Mixia osmundae IAM 14324]